MKPRSGARVFQAEFSVLMEKTKDYISDRSCTMINETILAIIIAFAINDQ